MHQEFEVEYTYRGERRKTTIVADSKDQALKYFDRNFLHDKVEDVKGKIFMQLY